MIQAVVTDIEGTTSSLAFVKDVLFPYARTHLAEFVQAHGAEPAVRAALDDAARLAGLTPPSAGGASQAVVRQLLQWIDEDRKATPLKALQGLIWEAGYRRGDFHGHIYQDAYEQLRAWQRRGLKLYVYSSGSVHAQKLLFEHTEYGDLRPLFAGYFDTRIGAKTEPESYRAILDELGLAGDEVLFLSDIDAELAAAQAAGMQVIQLLRDGPPTTDTPYRQVADFSAIAP